MLLLNLLFIALAVVAAIPVAVYCLEIAASLWPARLSSHDDNMAAQPRAVVIVPAHNEAAGIAGTLHSIAAQLQPHDELLVIADNCTDSTAAIAREQGSTVIERHDTFRRGKGYALAFALESLRESPPEVVVFCDADCRLESGAIDELRAAATLTQRPVQALYLCHATEQTATRTVVSGLAFRFRNQVRALGLQRLGGVCHLTGSGMALPWSLVERVNWASDNLVEDMQLGIDFTIAGLAPQFVPRAVIASELPAGHAAQSVQRRRWEHGFLQTARTQVPRLLASAVRHRSRAALCLALDMTVPPLALLTASLACAWGAALLLAAVSPSIIPLVIISAALLAFALATAGGWLVHCRRAIPFHTLLAVPGYVLGKLPLYFAYLQRRETAWVRTDRTSTASR